MVCSVQNSFTWILITSRQKMSSLKLTRLFWKVWAERKSLSVHWISAVMKLRDGFESTQVIKYDEQEFSVYKPSRKLLKQMSERR